MACFFELELHDGHDQELLSDDEANGADGDASVLNVTEIEVR